ncbi:ATP-binding cassette domain-containing protein [Paenibacillus sp. 32352]|uniref:ATP-binding cassette domain-containing protein n=1 Tax=Paenibacillus sp. 32352 TaxID=1969111 RepID=UPI0009AD8BF6|nr:ABC transporter ATP-binding protein [Paenibacillus sp. 32352]
MELRQDPIVVFEQVRKHFYGSPAIQDISFTIPRGQIVGIMGTNGSGKSTILRLMTGLQRPSSGRVLLNGSEAKRLSARQVAFLPDRDVFYPMHTVEKSLRFYNELFPDFRLARAFSMIETFELELGKKLVHLSKGSLARLKMVLALSRQVPLVVMDEPLSGLDPLIRESIIRSVIASIDMGEQTIVMTTHEVEEVEPLLDKAMLIKEGRLLGYEDVEHIRQNYGVGLVEWMRHSAFQGLESSTM